MTLKAAQQQDGADLLRMHPAAPVCIFESAKRAFIGLKLGSPY